MGVPNHLRQVPQFPKFPPITTTKVPIIDDATWEDDFFRWDFFWEEGINVEQVVSAPVEAGRI